MNSPRAIHRHLVKALAAGALLAAAALPMAIATAAGAATTFTVVFSPTGGNTAGAYFGTGATGTVTITASATTFAGDGGNASITTNAPGVTFSSVVDDDTTGPGEVVSADFASTSATAPGSYNLTITDNAGTTTIDDAFNVYPAPTFTSLTPTSGPDQPGIYTATITVTGGGFTGTATKQPVVTFTSTVDGTSMAATAVTGAGTTETTPGSSLTLTVPLKNTVTGNPATPGTYTMTIENADGGSVTTGAVFTVVGDVIDTVSPSGIAVPNSGTTNTTVNIIGSGFQAGATVTWGTCLGVTFGTAVIDSSTEITVPVSVPAGTSSTSCDVTVDNDGTNDNGASYTATGALGIGTTASSLSPLVTASSLSSASALVPGSPSSSTITFTGQGFGPESTFTVLDPAGNNAGVTVGSPCLASSDGTTLTCTLTANSGAVAGSYTAVFGTDTLANAFSVAGPAITSISPTALAVGAPVGTVVTITGTGFNNTTTGTFTDNGGDTTAGIFEYVSATQINFVVTASPSVANAIDTFYVKSYNAYGATSVSAPTSLVIDNTPSVTSIAYTTTGTSGVGVGATAQGITINGSNFESGATVTAFTNASGKADADVTAKVTSVNLYGTQISATISVAAGDTAGVDGYTVTNPDGGSYTVSAIAPIGLTIDAAPTVSAVSPSTATPSATNAFTVTGTGFETGAVVTASSDGTCGVATVASATSLTVSCTLGAEGSTAVNLVVTNPDGGSAASATVLPAQTTPSAPSFHVSAVHGAAVHGKTVTLTISGTGFYGQPKISSTAKGVKAVVTKDNGKVLTVRVSTPANVRGWHTFTVTLANGKSGKVNYQTK